jgi:very-short-patch-repair endonuclease
MSDLHLDLAAPGGIARTRALTRLGHTSKRLSRAVGAGELVRPRAGWVATPDSDPAALRAVELGGRLASTSALVSLGIWVDDPGPLVVSVPPNGSRLPAPRRGEVRIWDHDRFPSRRGVPWRVSTLDALLQFGHGATRSALVASVDSALHLDLITNAGVFALGDRSPRGHRRLPNLVDRRAESGNETHLRVALRDLGLRVDIQVELPLVGRVDLLVEGWLIVEADSRAHHGTTGSQDRDRARDGNAVLMGYAVIRFMPESVSGAIGWCVDVVRARLLQGRPVGISGPGTKARRILV